MLTCNRDVDLNAYIFVVLNYTLSNYVNTVAIVQIVNLTLLCVCTCIHTHFCELKTSVSIQLYYSPLVYIFSI